MNGGTMLYYRDMNSEKDIPIFLNNCPAVVKMIEDKVYLKTDIEKIVNYYNNNCGIK